MKLNRSLLLASCFTLKSGSSLPRCPDHPSRGWITSLSSTRAQFKRMIHEHHFKNFENLFEVSRIKAEPGRWGHLVYLQVYDRRALSGEFRFLSTYEDQKLGWTGDHRAGQKFITHQDFLSWLEEMSLNLPGQITTWSVLRGTSYS